MRKLVQTDLALDDLASIWSFIAKEDPAAATRLLERIDVRVKLVAKYPSLGEVDERISTQCRRIVVGNYLIFYFFDDIEVRVLRVFHASRRIEDLRLN